jgi:NADPH:quinone reductase-like Zn-dependent oxidoreductase
MPPTMIMALRAHARGGPEQLVYEQAPSPVPGPGEALVEVHAAAITFAELTWDQTWTTRDGRDRTPTIPSHEVSGTVMGLGPDARGVAVSQDVYGLIDFDRDGAAAQYVTVPAAHLATRPRSVSHVESATLPLAALTAWQALVDHADLKPGEQVLVQGGAGGVGSYVVQLAASLGAVVTATGRAAQREFILGLGASTFLASDSADGADPDDGRLRPVLSQTFPLRDGRKAFESATVPHPPGKTVLIVR